MENYLKDIDTEFTFHLEDLVNMKPSIIYEYVSMDIAEVVARRLKNIKAYYVKRYIESTEEFMKSYEKLLLDAETPEYKIHTNLGKFTDDDVLIIGETDKQWVYVYFDKDVSDCSVCFLAKKGNTQYQEYITQNGEKDVYLYVNEESYDTLEDFAKDVIAEFNYGEHMLLEIPAPDGYIKW